MNDQNNGDENRGHESWLSSLARIYGPWHLGITAIQGIAWAAFVYWNESGKHAYWADTAQVVGEKTWAALPAFFITSAIILVIIQKGGRMVLTFVDERRKRIEKARAEGRAEGRAEVRAEVREALEEAYSKWTDWNRRREEAERRGERFDEPPPSLNGR